MKRADFLTGMAQALASLALYGPRHPASQRAIDLAYDRLAELLQSGGHRTFTFLDGEVLVDGEPLEALRGWDWARRFAAVGVERVEIDEDATRDDFERFVDEVQARLVGQTAATAELRQLAAQRIRYGPLRVAGGGGLAGDDGVDGALAAAGSVGDRLFSLQDEAAAVTWLHGEVQGTNRLPMAEVDAVVRSLAHAMHGERRLLLPLLELRSFDEYTTTHACNVAMLSMGLAEQLGLGRDDVRAFGIAGLLHDLGKVRIPIEILTKPGRLTDEERTVVQRHPEEGAKLVLERGADLQLAAVVAYEHHICLDGTGYPAMRFQRPCHYASRIVHVCDIYDALCTDRPYRSAWEPEKALRYLEERAGVEVEGDIVQAFATMVRGAELRRAPIEA